MKSEERRVKNPCAKVMLASIINKANVPADLRSAGIKYKDLLIRLKYRCFTKVSKARKKLKVKIQMLS